MKKKIKFLAFIVFAVIIWLSFSNFKKEKPKETLNLTLKGTNIITLKSDEKYKEPGFEATYGNIDLTKNVQIEGKVENKEGTYELIYKIKYGKTKAEAHRFVKVQKPKEIIYKDTYDNIDNTSRGWWSGNKKDGSRPAGGADINELKKYNAYFLGPNTKTLYLTFDEGGNETYVKEIVDVLNQNNVKATFFFCLHYMKSNEQLVAKIAKDGHTIGNHTATHLNMPSLATSENFKKYLEEITLIEQEYKKITGKEMEKVYRDPRGEWSYRDLQIMKDLGYRAYFYSADYQDFKEESTKEKALAELSKRIHNGAIYLIHPKNKGNYLALDSLIKEAKKQGYTFDLVKNIK